jgi:hypothetical protein
VPAHVDDFGAGRDRYSRAHVDDLAVAHHDGSVRNRALRDGDDRRAAERHGTGLRGGGRLSGYARAGGWDDRDRSREQEQPPAKV